MGRSSSKENRLSIDFMSCLRGGKEIQEQEKGKPERRQEEGGQSKQNLQRLVSQLSVNNLHTTADFTNTLPVSLVSEGRLGSLRASLNSKQPKQARSTLFLAAVLQQSES